jgi:6-phosphogluconolactonase
MSVVAEHEINDPAQLANSLAEVVATRLSDAIAARGQALLAVSGGESPKALYAALARKTLDWSAVVVTLVDERWVAAGHADSNAHMVRENLLAGPAAAARFVVPDTSAATPQVAAAEWERELRALGAPFDVVLLGMGADGHTASWFPGAPGLQAMMDVDQPTLCATAHPPLAARDRITLTLRAVQSARFIVLQFSGAAKQRVYRAARVAGPVAQYPVRAVLQQAVAPVEVWCAVAPDAPARGNDAGIMGK